MAAVALFIVHRSLSRVRHALIWAAAFALTALRWGIIGFSDLGKHAIANAPDLAMRASFDIAEYRPCEPLYRSKREGRNRATLAPREAC